MNQSVTLVPRKSLTVTVVNNNGSFTPSDKSDVAITTNMIVVPTAGSFDGLSDVVEVSPQTGDVPVYNKATDKYIVETLNLDGGIF